MEWVLISVGGLLGSAHCVGMCGPLALALGMSETRLLANARRQLAFSMGRLFTYAFLGGAAGLCGARLVQESSTMVNLQAVLAVAAGLFLLLMGLHSTGLVKGIRKPAWGFSLCSTRLIRTFLTTPGWTNAVMAGVFTGFLPCGLVYAFLAMAAAAGDPGRGAATMAFFGAGTIPLMVLTGCGAALMSAQLRMRVFQLAAWCVVVTGLISIGRGLGYLQMGSAPPVGCPFCP